MYHAVTAIFFPQAIFTIPQQRVADMGHLSPNLMGATGFQPDLHQRQIPAAGQYPIVGNGCFGAGPGSVKYLDPVGTAVFQQVIFQGSMLPSENP